MTKLSIDIIRQDGGTQPRSTVHDDWIADYADDMQSGAVFPPVVVFFDGNEYWLADGFHRVGAAVASGLTDIEADVRQGTQRDAVLFSVSANAQHGHRRTNEDKRRAVDVLLNDPKWSKWSDREIARRCNVSNRFVSNMRHGDTREFPPSQNLDTVNGSQYPRNETVYTHPRTGQPAVMHTANIGQCGGGGFGDLQIDTGQRVDPVVALTTYDDAEVLERAKQILSREGRDVVAKFEEEIANLSNTEVGFGDFEDDEDDEDDADEVPVHNHRAQGTGENEWYTPTHYIEAAREVMGGIDLDPASSEIPNETVQARRFFTIDDDGLKQRWKGNVWLNPPYAQPWIAMFMEKLTEEVEKGNVKQAIALTHNYTDTKWFRSAGVMADRVCLTAGRIAFLDPNGKKAAPTQGQAFFYFGPNRNQFVETFSKFGWFPNTKDVG